MTTPRLRILVATGDVLHRKMAGPAIRAWEIARALSNDHEVHLVSTLECSLEHDAFAVSFADGDAITQLVEASDVIIFQGNLMAQHPIVRTTDKVVVADIYDPFHLEVLEQARGLPPIDRLRATQPTTRVLNEQLRRGDFFLCASEKQRDFWLGQLAGMERLNQATYDEHENLRSLIDVVPFGVADDAPMHTKRVLKGVHPNIAADDLLLLWGGGVYNWFDPLTLIRAVDRLKSRVPNVRLYFLGLKHPNPHVGEMSMAVQTRDLAERLRLVDTHVFFNEDWVPYEDRQNYLLESDVGVSTHFDHVETAFSFRTRILDYLWAGLPVVSTAGDSLADMVTNANAGFAVPPEDVDALEAALFELLTDTEVRDACARGSAELGRALRWEHALVPLVAFCASPRRAPDLVDPLLNPDPPIVYRAERFVERAALDAWIILRGLWRGEFRDLVERTRNRWRTRSSRNA